MPPPRWLGASSTRSARARREPTPRRVATYGAEIAGNSAITGHSTRLKPAARHQLCGDDVALDFVRAFADDHQRGVAEVAFDVVFGGIAVAAVDANRIQ